MAASSQFFTGEEDRKIIVLYSFAYPSNSQILGLIFANV